MCHSCRSASKADGTLRYTDDLPFEGLYGAAVRSEIAYGKIRAITFDPSFDFSNIVIVDHRDIEGRNANVVLTDDQPFLAEARVRHIGELILLLAHRYKHRRRGVGLDGALQGHRVLAVEEVRAHPDPRQGAEGVKEVGDEEDEDERRHREAERRGDAEFEGDRCHRDGQGEKLSGIGSTPVAQASRAVSVMGRM
ncbi:MAG: hypothetical protein IE886_08680 [Campylobacterales bacterium]|nr:hypothetical protein [Campylobacterales bacterium]